MRTRYVGTCSVCPAAVSTMTQVASGSDVEPMHAAWLRCRNLSRRRDDELALERKICAGEVERLHDRRTGPSTVPGA